MPTPDVKKIRVHRFQDRVAVSTFPGPSRTIYLTEDQASWLASELKKAEYDISAHQFTESRYKSTELES